MMGGFRPLDPLLGGASSPDTFLHMGLYGGRTCFIGAPTFLKAFPGPWGRPGLNMHPTNMATVTMLSGTKFVEIDVLAMWRGTKYCSSAKTEI